VPNAKNGSAQDASTTIYPQKKHVPAAEKSLKAEKFQK
jgi:hypothetical protein